MFRLSRDMGISWSRFVWDDVVTRIPLSLWQGLKKPKLNICLWCGGGGNLEHFLFSCREVKSVCDFILSKNSKLISPWSDCIWCFGALKTNLNLIVWVVNFAVYKAMINACEDNNLGQLKEVVNSECSKYEHLFPMLADLV